jgi:hypothetical protein
MNIVAYGGGINSTAMLIECVNRNIKIDLILFADTGGEKPHTYEYLKTFRKWCIENGLPKIITVQQVNQYGTAITLEQLCLNKHMLPSLAYGHKACSGKHKIAPQDKYVNNWLPAKSEWKAGRKITKLIGYDADEPHRGNIKIDKKYNYWHPLKDDWDMGRDECIKTIKNSGLCLPGKSACFYCPSSHKSEILELQDMYPQLMDRAIAIEQGADLRVIKGLARRWAWKDLIRQKDAFGFERPPELSCDCYDGN